MKNNAVRIGLLTGFGTVFCLLLVYWINKRLALNPIIIWGTTLFYLIGMFSVAVGTRAKASGHIDFRSVLKPAFLVFVIANAIYHLYNYSLFNFFDPEMLIIQKELILEQEASLSMMDEAQRTAFLQGIMNYGFKNMLFSYSSSLIGGFIIAVIIALIVKRAPIRDTG